MPSNISSSSGVSAKANNTIGTPVPGALDRTQRMCGAPPRVTYALEGPKLP